MATQGEIQYFQMFQSIYCNHTSNKKQIHLNCYARFLIIWVNQTIKFGNLAYMSTITVQIKLKQWSTNLKYIYPYICASASIKADMINQVSHVC